MSAILAKQPISGDAAVSPTRQSALQLADMILAIEESGDDSTMTLGDEGECDCLPKKMCNIEDYEKYARHALMACRLVDNAFVVAQSLTTPYPNWERDVDLICDALDLVHRNFSEFWFMHNGEMFSESDHTRGDLPASWLPAAQSCAYIYTESLVSIFALNSVRSRLRVAAGRKPVSSSVPMTSVTGWSFESVYRQGLVQYAKPICYYNCDELLWAMDALARHWFTIRYTPEISSYVLALTIRYGTLLRCGSRPDEVGDNKVLVTKPAAAPDTPIDDSTHVIPADEPLRPRREWLAPSRLFREMGAARIGAFAATVWRVERYEAADAPQFTDVIGQAADAMDIATGKNLQVPPLPDRSVDSLYRHLAPRALPPGPTGSIRAVGFTPRYGALQVAELLYRYATESATAETTRDVFSKKLIECALCPGDMAAFSAKHRHTSPTPSNVIKLMRGDRFTKELLRRAKTVGPEGPLKSAVKKLRHSLREGPAAAPDSRSDMTLDEEIAALCLMDALFKNRYGIDWSDEYMMTGGNHAELTRSEVVLTASNRDEKTHHADDLYARLPRIAMLCNTFDIVFEGHILHTSSLFESLAWWLDIIGTVYDSKLPAPKGNAANQEDSAVTAALTKRSLAQPAAQKRRPALTDTVPTDLLPLTSVADVCATVRRGHDSYIIRTSGDEVTRFSTMTLGSETMSVITGV